jgi:MarR family 2-MHQ and catechol resistance regulon transcriptional repressor
MNAPKISYGPAADLALSTFVKLVRAHNTLYRLDGQHIRGDYGLTLPQFSVIDGIGHLGPMTMGELTRRMLATGGNTTVVVDNLEKAGLVQRCPSDEDRRVIRVELTAQGRALFERIFPDHAAFMQRAMSPLTEKEQGQLGDLLRKLGRHLAEHGVPDAPQGPGA